MPRYDPLPSDAVSTTIHVRYAETDQMKVAHHSNYLVWFELSRAGYCRHYGIDYREMEALGLFLPVVEAQCRFLSPARYDDELEIQASVKERTSRTIRFQYRVIRGETLLAVGETYHFVVDANGKPTRWLPQHEAHFPKSNP